MLRTVTFFFALSLLYATPGSAQQVTAFLGIANIQDINDENAVASFGLAAELPLLSRLSVEANAYGWGGSNNTSIILLTQDRVLISETITGEFVGNHSLGLMGYVDLSQHQARRFAIGAGVSARQFKRVTDSILISRFYQLYPDVSLMAQWPLRNRMHVRTDLRFGFDPAYFDSEGFISLVFLNVGLGIGR